MIPFNKPYLTGKETHYIYDAVDSLKLSGNGKYTKLCQQFFVERYNFKKTLLTTSCTDALEMAAILIDIQPGDEVIIPSFTFVSTANAFVLRGAIPVFVDIRMDTLNIDENLISQAITKKTVAIVVVHYAGVSCEMNKIKKIAKINNLYIVEDAAQGILCKYNKKPLGSIGSFGTFSFHESKNIICGEGGALLINDKKFINRAQIIREKGTDRTNFISGKVDKYSWKDIGSSFLLSDLNSSFLFAQFKQADMIIRERLLLWNLYHELFNSCSILHLISLPTVPDSCEHNGHIYFIILDEKLDREKILKNLALRNVYCLTHYVPLHSTDAGKKYARFNGKLNNTNHVAAKIIRLPLWVGMTKDDIYYVFSTIEKTIKKLS